MLFPEKIRARSCLKRLATVLNLPVSKSTATVSGVASSAVPLANAKDAGTMRTKRIFLNLSL